MPEVSPMPLTSGPITVNTQMPQEKLQRDLSPQPDTKPAVEEPKITAETSPQDAMRIAASIRREKLLRKQSRELEEQRKQFQVEQEALKPWKTASELAKKNKLEALKSLGISYDELTNQVLNDGQVPPQIVAQNQAEQTALAEIAKLRAELQEQRVKEQQTNYQQAIQNIDAEVKSVADSNEKFLLVKESGAYHDVTEYIEKEYHRTGTILPVNAALEKVNSEILTGLQDLLKIDGIRNLLFPRAETQIEPQLAQTNQKINTLTHKAFGTPPAARAFTAAEKRQRAINVARGLPPDA